MEKAWLTNWKRSRCQDLTLIFLDASPGLEAVACVAHNTLENVYKMFIPDGDGYIPGILHKTHVALDSIVQHCPTSWVFRTNLSSHVVLHELQRFAEKQPADEAVSWGYSPLKNHLSGCGFGMNSAGLAALVQHWSEVDASLIDDVAISHVLFSHTRVIWTGRLDNVWPDGRQLMGQGPLYHVRVKTLDREHDAALLEELGEYGLS